MYSDWVQRLAGSAFRVGQRVGALASFGVDVDRVGLLGPDLVEVETSTVSIALRVEPSSEVLTIQRAGAVVFHGRFDEPSDEQLSKIGACLDVSADEADLCVGAIEALYGDLVSFQAEYGRRGLEDLESVVNSQLAVDVFDVDVSDVLAEDGPGDAGGHPPALRVV